MNTLMNTTPSGGGKPALMSSREIAELTGKRHDHVKRDIEKLLTDLGEDIPKFGGIYLDSMNREQSEYLLDRDLTENLLLGYSPKLRRAVLVRMRELEAGLSTTRPLTTTETLIQMLTLQADVERRQAEQERRQIEQQAEITAQRAEISAAREEIAEIRQTLSIFDKVPANGELITHLRARIRKELGLSDKVTNQVLDASPYGLSPKFGVRNPREEAQGGVNYGYLKREVNMVFRRFISECRQVNATQWEHDYIEGRFRISPKK